jgi:hypothetical protein
MTKRSNVLLSDAPAIASIFDRSTIMTLAQQDFTAPGPSFQDAPTI